jgi:cysteinyl-tRNA synthetase
MLWIYNTLTRKKEEFISIKKDQVGLYACGPTVYWFAHIGNMRAFLFADFLRRTLEYNGYNVKMVMNITDVGHLTDDADEGEDKMLIAMRREGKTAYEIADAYTLAFMEDIAKLNITPAQEYPRVTRHIDEQIKMIQEIERNGFTYVTSDGVYFDTSKLPNYGALSGQKAEDKKAGARVDMKEKKNVTDFALWKFSPADAKREMEWESPWGVGFPGWHIECSAMSRKCLGFPFDIHTGGVDHISVHHENELAQSVGCCGIYEARFWMHSEFLTVDGGKMSKSVGNLFTLRDLIEKGFDPMAFRYFVLGAHYRTKLNFRWEALAAAQNALRRLQETVREWDAPKIGCAQYEQRFLEALNDDLNTPQALAVVWEMVEDPQLPTSGKAKSLLKFDAVLGLGLDTFVGKALVIPDDVRALVVKREEARTRKDWEVSDRLRAEIERKGYLVEDTEYGPKIRMKF